MFDRALFVLAALGLAIFAEPTSAKPFERPGLAKEAARVEAQIVRDTATGSRPAADWVKDGIAAVKRDDWRSAYASFGAAVAADPKSEQAWRNYAVALLRVEPEDNETYELPQRAQAAAFKAYLLANDAKAEARALAVLAEAFTRSSDHRLALNAYAESLRISEHPEVRQAYEQAREEHGFRVVDNAVDSDAASPRACFEFSEALAKGRRDFSPFVSVAGVDKPAVTAEGDKLCIDGLKHGETYEVTIRAGVPSSIGEDSVKPASATLYVRDRKPAVRFTGRNYVLPRTGQQGIPFVSVNVDRAAVEIYRVGEQGVGPEVTEGKFQRQLGGEELEQLRSNTGALVFRGEIEVDRALNQEVSTAVDLNATVKALQPGVYVMLAQPADFASDDSWEARPTQWFVVSDIGLTALSAGDGMHAFVRSLASAAPLAGVDLQILARNNEVLGAVKTNADGYAHFAAGLTKGEGALAPAVLIAAAAGDYGFLALTGSGFDLSDRGVEGRAAPGPLDALVYTERGVYRPGETVHVTTLLRNADGAAVEKLPLTLVFERPDGAEERRELVADGGAGGRVLDLALVSNATTGTWRVKAYAEEKRPPVGEASFLVEDYTPERLDLSVEAKAQTLSAAGVPLTVAGRWLYGAAAADLAVEADVTLRESQAPPAGMAGYRFGLSDEEVAPVRSELGEVARTGVDGHAELIIARPQLPATSKPLEAEIAVRLREPGGRTVERTLLLPVASEAARIGVKPVFDQLGEGETAQFDVRFLGKGGGFEAARQIRWELSRLNTRYQWYSEGSDWKHETVTTAAREADGVIDISAEAPARISAKVGSGMYRLEVASADPGGPATSIVFDAGWNTSASNAETPDTLDVALDKSVYAPGDTAKLRLDAQFAGRATIAVVGSEVSETRTLDVHKGNNEVPLPVTANWAPGAYVMAFLHRPLDAAASRMPGRAIGLAYAELDAAPRTLSVSMEAPAAARPRGTLRVPLKVGNLGAGEKAHLVVAAVDIGIVNLTDFKTPAPDHDAFAQRELAAEVRDLYGQLIDGMTARRGRIRTGGDVGGGMTMGEPPTQQPLALFSGLVSVDDTGTAEVAFDVPAFNGTVRLMAMAWSQGKLGHAEKDVVVADPVVVTASLPRFLAVGDQSRVRIDVHNVAGPAGTYSLSVDADTAAAEIGSSPLALNLESGARGVVDLPVRALRVGNFAAEIAITAPDGSRFAQTVQLPVQPAAPETTTRSVVQLAPNGGSIALSADLLKDFVAGTGSATLSIGLNPALEPAALIRALDEYPYGCSEQLASRLLAILYADDFGISIPGDTRSRAQDIIGRILARQSSTGSFGLWAAGEEDLWLDAYVTDVLTRIREKGHAVPERAVSLALQRLKNTLGYEGDFDGDTQASAFAYAHYVLARNGRPLIGDLRYLADSKIPEIASPLARAQVGAAMALAGDSQRAAKAFAAAEAALMAEESGTDRQDFGTRLRDGAGILALAAESSAASIIPAVSRRVGEDRGGRSALSTQENAWLLRASRALKQESARLALTVNGTDHAGLFNRAFGAGELANTTMVANAGPGAVTAAVTLRGSPTAMPQEASNGLSVSRTYYTLGGAVVDPARVAQNSRLVVVLSVKESEPQAGRLLVVDRLPAGFEIDNPRLVTSAQVENLPWLTDELAPEHAEFRDDRFVAAFSREEALEDDMFAAYIVRAVAPGTYVHPPATAEDMYRVERFGRTSHGTVEVEAAR